MSDAFDDLDRLPPAHALPDRVDSVRDLPADDLVQRLYTPSTNGLRLNATAVADYAEFLATCEAMRSEHRTAMAEIQADLARSRRQHRAMTVRRDVHAALVRAGVDRDLIDGAAALFIQQHPITVEAEGTGDARAVPADSGASLAFTAEGWLETDAGRPYRARKAASAEPGPFAAQLRAAAAFRQ